MTPRPVVPKISDSEMQRIAQKTRVQNAYNSAEILEDPDF